MRCTFKSRRPRPRYHTRFMRGPSFAIAFFTYRFSSVRLKLFSALAIADRTTVSTEAARRRELAEPVTDHVLGDEGRHVTVTVVHRDGVTDHDRQDHRRARPGLHDLLLVERVQDLDLLFEGLLDERPLLYGSAHLDFLFGGRSVTKRSVRGLLRVLRPMAGLPQGVCAWPPTGDLASPPPCGWSRGDITTPRTAGRQPMWRLWSAPSTFWFSCSTLPI